MPQANKHDCTIYVYTCLPPTTTAGFLRFIINLMKLKNDKKKRTPHGSRAAFRPYIWEFVFPPPPHP